MNTPQSYETVAPGTTMPKLSFEASVFEVEISTTFDVGEAPYQESDAGIILNALMIYRREQMKEYTEGVRDMASKPGKPSDAKPLLQIGAVIERLDTYIQIFSSAYEGSQRTALREVGAID